MTQKEAEAEGFNGWVSLSYIVSSRSASLKREREGNGGQETVAAVPALGGRSRNIRCPLWLRAESESWATGEPVPKKTSKTLKH